MEKLCQETELQTEKIHQIEWSLEKVWAAFQVLEEEISKAKEDAKAFKKETTQAKGN